MSAVAVSPQNTVHSLLHFGGSFVYRIDGRFSDIRFPESAGNRDVMEEESDMKEREELFLRVDDLVRTRLTDIQQYIIRRHQYEGASLEKVARELGMKPPAVRMQLSRARKTIRELYGNEKQNLL